MIPYKHKAIDFEKIGTEKIRSKGLSFAGKCGNLVSMINVWRGLFILWAEGADKIKCLD